MDFSDLAGKAAGMLGGNTELLAKLQELDLDPEMLKGLSLDDITGKLEAAGLDLSLLEGVDLDALVKQFLGGDS